MRKKKERIYSVFLKKHLSERQLKRASRVLIRGLDSARFKVLMAAFRKWRIRTVADILRIRPRKILKIRGVGKTKINILTGEIEKVVFAKINLSYCKPSLEVPDTGLLLGRELTSEEKKLLSGLSIESAIDDIRTRGIFQSLGKKTVISATKVSCEQFLSVRNAGRGSLKKAFESIEGIIKELARKECVIELSEEGIKCVVDGHILSCLPDNQKAILKDRYGLWDGVSETLEDISHKLGVTRARVHQIQKKAEDSLRRMAIPRLFVARLFERFKSTAQEELQKTYDGLASLDDLESAIFKIDKEAMAADLAYSMLKSIFYPDKNPIFQGLIQCGDGVLAFNNEARSKFEKICAAFELALVSKGKPQSPEDLVPIISKSVGISIQPAFLKRCGELCAKTGLDAGGKIGLKRWTHFNAQSLEQMVRMALVELGTPSHYSHIAAKMNVMFPHRAPFSERSVHSRLSMHSDIFVWAGRRGTYALVDWGIKQYPFIKDFLAQELQQVGSPMREEELVSRGVAKYGYREASIRMTLALQKRIFKRLPDGYYILNH